MTRRGKWIAVGLVLLIVGGVAFVLLDPDARVRGRIAGEPFYRGRAATAWRRDLRQPDEAAAVAARDALVAGKGEAVPVCVWLLEHAPEPEVRWRAADALRLIGKPDAAAAGPVLVKALDDPDPLVRGAVVQAIGVLAPGVPEAVPALVRLFPDVQAIGAVANFGLAGAEAIPRLVELLRHPDSKVRWNAARALGKIGELTPPEVQELVAVMGADPDALVREHCAESLGQIGPKAAVAVPALVKALADPEPKVRRDAVRSLGQFGPAAKAALAEVKARTKDENERVREAAAKAARQIDPAGK